MLRNLRSRRAYALRIAGELALIACIATGLGWAVVTLPQLVLAASTATGPY